MMDTKFFFQMFLALLVIGTFCSLITGVTIPAWGGGFATNTTVPVGNATLLGISSGLENVIATPGHPNATYTCSYDMVLWMQQSTYTCGLIPTDNSIWNGFGIIPILSGIWSFLTWVFASIVAFFIFIITVIAFFTGIGAFLSTQAIPEPFNFMISLVVAFAWLFLALEVIQRVWSVLGKNGGGG
jgi:hypothetical protein